MLCHNNSKKGGNDMNTIQIKKSATQLVAHRGLSGIETENTNAAFVAAGNRSYYGIETDIHRTGDGRFVVCHDFDLKRIAGVDLPVESTSLSELQSVVLFDKDGSKSREDIRLSVLENYLGICKKYSKHCVLELKSDFTDAEISQIIDIVKSFDYLENVTFISFLYANLTKIRAICPTQSVQFLFSEFSEEIISRLVADKIDVDVYYKALTKEMITRLHEKGLVVNCWTVDNKETAEQLSEWGVDYITTNILEAR
jgi:glycerophosphoryl diester phosphodiesterase